MKKCYVAVQIKSLHLNSPIEGVTHIVNPCCWPEINPYSSMLYSSTTLHNISSSFNHVMREGNL